MSSISKKIRLLIADDQPVILRGLSIIIGSETDIEVVGLANDGAEAVQLAIELCPDVIIMDLHMPNLSGVEAIRNIMLHNAEIKIIVLTTIAESELISNAIRSGAHTYLLKDAAEQDILKTIRSALPSNSSGANEILCQNSQQPNDAEVL